MLNCSLNYFYIIIYSQVGHCLVIFLVSISVFLPLFSLMTSFLSPVMCGAISYIFVPYSGLVFSRFIWVCMCMFLKSFLSLETSAGMTTSWLSTEAYWLAVSTKPFFFKLKLGASLVVEMIKNLPAVQDGQVQFLAREAPLEKGVASHSRTLAWRIPRTGEGGGRSPCCGKESDTREWLTLTHLTCLVYDIALASGVQQMCSATHSVIFTCVCIHI